MTDLLKIINLHVYYGGIHALKGVSLNVGEGGLVTLIGANGAGKSTLLRAVAGQNHISRGSILWHGDEISNQPPHMISRKAMALVPEGRKVFANLSVRENLLMGAYMRRDQKQVQKDMNRIVTFFPNLKNRMRQKAGTLSGGEQQMLALGRALMAEPSLLMLDEPSLGLAPLLVEEVFGIIKEIHQKGKTVLLIEQNAMAALSVADYGYVLETGRVTLENTGAFLLDSEAVQEKYLGGEIGV